MSRSLVRWRVRELLVLDNRLRASVRQPRSFGGGGADFCSQHKGSDWSRLGALVVRWNRVGYRSLDEASARGHSLFTRAVCVFGVGGVVAPSASTAADNLFLCETACGDRVRLHLRLNATAEEGEPDAKRDDSRDCPEASKIPHIRWHERLLVEATRI